MNLTVRGLAAGYGSVTVVRDVGLEVAAGQVLALVGANGAGKSTLLRCIAGLLRPKAGSICLDGRDVTGRPAHHLARMGMALVPEGRQLFAELTVQENLRMGLYGCLGRSQAQVVSRRLEQVYALFPILAQFGRRRAGALSGGQQQMLAIGRALVRDPAVLLLDEPSLGVAPMLVEEIFSRLQALRSAGVAVLLVEQNAAAALRIADLACVMEGGQLSAARPASELLLDEEVGRAYLGAGVQLTGGASTGQLADVIGRPLFT